MVIIETCSTIKQAGESPNADHSLQFNNAERCPSGRKVQHWKCCVGQPTAGSNPALSANSPKTIVTTMVLDALQIQSFSSNGLLFQYKIT